MRKIAILTATTVLVLTGGSTAVAFAAGSDDGPAHHRHHARHDDARHDARHHARHHARHRHVEPGDDRGGATRHVEPGDDHGGRHGGGHGGRHGGHGSDD
jgi:hypothetical protein